MTRDQFIRHATRGLWGTRKRDAALELRGAIEDKIYRHQLCGLSAADAERAALRDLGSPHAIARDLSGVHTAPAAIRATLLLGVVGLLGVQAVAQIPAVGSRFEPREIGSCDLDLESASAEFRARMERIVAHAGGPANLRAQCLAGAFASSGALLEYAALRAALTAAHVHVRDTASVTLLSISDSPDGTTMSRAQTDTPYLPSRFLLPFLMSALPEPFTLVGLTNPTLVVGQARIPLGSRDAPIRTVDVLAQGLLEARVNDPALPIPRGLKPVMTTFAFDPAAPQLAVPGQDGEIFAVVQNVLRINEDRRGADAPETLWVRARQGGRIAFTDELTPDIRLVNSQAALDQATARGVKAAVVYRVNATNLQHPVLTPVPATQVRVVKP